MPFSISLRLFNKTIPKLQYAENAAESVEIHDLEVLKSQNIIRPQQMEAKLSQLVNLIYMRSFSFILHSPPLHAFRKLVRQPYYSNLQYV